MLSVGENIFGNFFAKVTLMYGTSMFANYMSFDGPLVLGLKITGSAGVHVRIQIFLKSGSEFYILVIQITLKIQKKNNKHFFNCMNNSN